VVGPLPYREGFSYVEPAALPSPAEQRSAVSTDCVGRTLLSDKERHSREGHGFSPAIRGKMTGFSRLRKMDYLDSIEESYEASHL
jgi:hypothetical protein